MMREPDMEPNDVLGLLVEQRDLYVQLGALSDRQRSLITSDEPERLLELLGERQRIVDRLSLLAGRFRPIQQNWREVRGRMAPAQGTQVDNLVAELNLLLTNILRKDEADAELLSVRKTSVSKEMSSLKTGRQAQTAYTRDGGSDAYSSGGWIDE